MTIQEVIDSILRTLSEVRLEKTADTIKCGDGSTEAKGIVTTFTVNMDVLRQAVQKNANFIITHEPTFYNHWDDTAWLADNPVYLAKKQFIEENHLTIWRFHDYMHLHKPDLINTGVLQQLGWEEAKDQDNERIVNLPGLPLRELVEHLKSKLSVPAVRIVGNPEMTCRRVGMLLGAIGGEGQIDFMSREQVDTVICGETVEWQTCEFVRDAVLAGRSTSLVILGHFYSEDAGMKYLVEWLQEKVPGVPVEHIPAGDPIMFL